MSTQSLTLQPAGQKTASTGNIRYMYTVSGSKSDLSTYREDIDNGTFESGVIGEKDLLFFSSKKLDGILLKLTKLTRSNKGYWFLDDSKLRIANEMAEKYPALAANPELLKSLLDD